MIEWIHKEITHRGEANEVLARLYKHIKYSKVTAAAFDTETTGLHPILDVPFLYQCGWYCKEFNKGIAVVMDLETTPKDVQDYFLTHWHKLMADVPVYLGHHVVYDLHMMHNYGYDYSEPNISDTQFYIRASSDAVQADKGGEPLGLKDWAVRHISKDANSFEKELKQERTAKAKALNDKLLRMTGWKKKEFDEFFNDKTNDYTDLPQQIQAKYLLWHSELPEYLKDKVTATVESDMIQYNTLDRAMVKKYGYKDIEYTLECHNLCTPVIDVRKNWEQVRRENQQIYPLFRMERVGFKVNREYVAEAKKKTKAYIQQRRSDLEALAQTDLKVGQHAKIKSLLSTLYGVTVDGTGKEELEILVSNLKRAGGYDECIEFIETILELRTLEKWYSTYICRFDYELKRTDRIYTSIHQVETVSGRVSCNFQQFPKEGLVTLDGIELFSPREMVIVDDDYPAIVYLDYSQIELRLQALYTYLLGEPDLNLCRAYSPFRCHRADGRAYDPEKDTKEAYQGTWYTDESNEPWVPTDVHGATTEKAFGITPQDERFHALRYVGKRVNFAKNYGASIARIRQMFPEYSEEECKRIDEAYYKAFPGVKNYHEACFRWAEEPWMDNLFGVKYYGVSGHNLRNILIQGSGAYFLKEKIAKVDEYLQTNHCKSKFVMQIHDELQFYWSREDDPKIFFDIKNIMEDTEAQIPIIADMEVTTTTWKAKVEVESLDELYKICNWN